MSSSLKTKGKTDRILAIKLEHISAVTVVSASSPNLDSSLALNS